MNWMPSLVCGGLLAAGCANDSAPTAPPPPAASSTPADPAAIAKSVTLAVSGMT